MTVDDSQAEHLTALATAASILTSSTSSSIQTLHSSALASRTASEHAQDSTYLSLAPTFLSLHQQASSSKQLLDSLEGFLSTFQSDLSTLSTHISALQNTSHAIGSRLDATRDVEIRLASFLSEIALSPRIVDLFFETEPESRPELWLKAVKQLEKVLEATSPSATLSLPPGAAERVADMGEIQAVQQVRRVAEACKNIVASKLRTFLISPHTAIKASVTTNLQVLQNSVLLRHHKPFYAFLARQMPRVAIDVQRSYVQAARLYFETAFRRYARSLVVVRKRWVEAPSGGGLLLTEALPSNATVYGAGGIAALQNGMSNLNKALSTTGSGVVPGRGSNTPTSKDASNLSDSETMSNVDPWLFSTNRLLYSKLDSPVTTVLGYLADDSSFKASPENLFRSLSLVLIDNACSEFTFLVRFFQGISEDLPSTQEARVGEEESADTSQAGDATPTQSETGPEPSVVQLSLTEQSKMKGKGATEEIFRQIMEPCITTWSNFATSLLMPPGSAASSIAASATSVVSASSIATGGVGGVGAYFSLLSMLTLNDALSGLVQARGCSNSVLESALMRFKITAYPLAKRFLDDQIASLSTLSNPGSTSSSASTGVWGVLNSLTSTNSASATLTEQLGEAISIRYASLFTKTLWILTTTETADQGILSALLRLRSQLAKLISIPNQKSWTREGKLKMVKTLIQAIEAVVGVSAGGLASHGKVQNEFSFWHEQLHQLPQ
ncbi:related to VPS52-component of the Golgi-associated retrograde protein complex [Ustilago bromivora]|uniref:Related to VPS52 - component of the Golgi-associated retrograde protein complex n=1 Tax=Ustilago bromivora TaxID=307758 RepID=A0A1K0G0R0_9BASI|nr:related to VPS52-component of the Golgi-associated retrograde protein complex [Ustilago bromivora]SYW82376.1 related to VPS52 - component of the Golgi-associated retrograde protein complex [Ustilago bromivora]